MQLLLDDRFAPITSSIGFLEADLTVVVERYLQWKRNASYIKNGRVSLHQRSISGNLETALKALLPLANIPQRLLFIPTRNGWTVQFDNGWRGSGPDSTVSFFAQQIGCRGVIVTAVSHTKRKVGTSTKGRWGAVILDVYGPHQTDWLNRVRTIRLACDVDGCEFEEGGTPFDFEELDRYKAKNVMERFTFEMLDRYAQALGLSPFQESFYRPEQAILVEEKGPKPPGLKTYTLEEVQAAF